MPSSEDSVLAESFAVSLVSKSMHKLKLRACLLMHEVISCVTTPRYLRVSPLHSSNKIQSVVIKLGVFFFFSKTGIEDIILKTQSMRTTKLSHQRSRFVNVSMFST